MFLVDTSVWVEVFRKPSRVRLDEEVPLDQVATCLPIVQEVLQGFREEPAFLFARQNLLSLPLFESPLTWEVFEMAAQLYRTGRKAGITIRSGVDCLIAACALRNDLMVLHIDRDFKHLAQLVPLKTREVKLKS